MEEYDRELSAWLRASLVGAAVTSCHFQGVGVVADAKLLGLYGSISLQLIIDCLGRDGLPTRVQLNAPECYRCSPADKKAERRD